VFQSRSGFSPCLDERPGAVHRLQREVSIPVWVFSLPRQSSIDWSASRANVSIPVWVFSLPRRYSVKSLHKWRRLFQSRSGFSPCLDPSCMVVCIRLDGCFNPGLGFLPASTKSSYGSSDTNLSFNPGLGFLPASTATSRGNCGESRVSIPVWVFSLPRRTYRDVRSMTGMGFQSRSGFSPCLDEGQTG